MSRAIWLSIFGLVGLSVAASSAWAQGEYIGFVYPAGGQQGTTFQIKVGGQRLDQVDQVFISGDGVSAQVVEFYRRMGNQELRFLRDQLKELKQKGSEVSPTMASMMFSLDIPEMAPPDATGSVKSSTRRTSKSSAKTTSKPTGNDLAKQMLADRIQRRISEDERQPACRSLAEVGFIEVTIDPDAEPGPREIVLVTTRGISNPMVFHVGQAPEVTRKPMKTSEFQVLGKEELAQRKRPPEEEEVRITTPCTMNGQIASGEVNRYRFDARRGQRLVISVNARELIPYIADAVPGWFQPVLTLSDAAGTELAYNDDFRFKPDPTLYFEVPEDGEYVLSITDAIFRGREDFVYRVTIGEQPFVTSVFPLGARVGTPAAIEMDGWNLEKFRLIPPPKDAGPGTHLISARKNGMVSNQVPFALDTLPECLDEESNNNQSKAQKVTLPIIVNGRVDNSNDWDVFEIEGRAGDKVVAEVLARRLDSPVDSILKITDQSGKLLAFNDDHMDAASGLNTHHADSYLMVELPADGKYFVHLGDTARNGGKEYAYRLRISPPRPDFELRVVPPNFTVRRKSSVSVNVYALRKDGFDGPIKLELKDLPNGLAASPVTLSPDKGSTKMTVKAGSVATEKPVVLSLMGTAKIGDVDVTHAAVPAEDRMQAFLWRHLVPAQNLLAFVSNSSYTSPATRVRPPLPEKEKPADAEADAKYTKKQVSGLVKQIERLYQEWLLTDDFTNRKIAEIEPAF